MRSVVLVCLSYLACLAGCGHTELELSCAHLQLRVRRKPKALEVSWTLTNRLSTPIWAIIGCERGERDDPNLPVGFVVPTGELLFTFGPFSQGDRRVVEIFSYRYVEKRINPKGAVSRTFEIPLPYELEEEIENPYEAERLAASRATRVRVTEAKGIYMAIRYYLGAWDAQASLRRRLSYTTMAEAARIGERLEPEDLLSNVIGRTATSELVETSVPLSRPVVLLRVETILPRRKSTLGPGDRIQNSRGRGGRTKRWNSVD